MGHLVVYNDVVHRTQIYLSDREVAWLDAAAARSGASRSELIRRAIRAQYGQESATTRRDAISASAGVWRGRGYSGAEFVDAIRGDVNERLERLRSS